MVKQKRKHWKKIDQTEVQEALEDDRRTEKLANIPAEELFSFDTSGSTKGLSRSVQKELKKAKAEGPKQRRYSAMELLKVEKAAKLLRNRTIADEKKAAKNAPAPPQVFDLWGAAAPSAKAAKAKDEEVDAHPARMQLKRKLEPQRAPGTLHQRTSKAPAVVVADEGQSVNPTSEAFEELACTEAATVLEKEREAAEMNRHARPLLHTLLEHFGHEEVKAMDGPTRLAKFQELTGGQGRGGGAEQRGGGGGGEEGGPAARAVKGRKTQVERNKQRRAQLNRERETEEQRQKKLLKSVGKVKEMLKTMGEEEEARRGQQEYKAVLKAQEEEAEKQKGVIPKNRRIGKHKYREAGKELPEVDEDGAAPMKTGLRRAKMLGSALKDRVQSIYRQGLLEMKPEATRQAYRRVQKGIRKRDKNRKFVNKDLKDGSLLLS